MIFVLGNICRDTSFYVDRMPLPGETANAARTRVGLGGKGLNQAIAASNAGPRVKLVAAVGEDWTSADAARVQDASDGHLELALVQKDGLLDCSSIIVSEKGENLIVTNPAQAEDLSIEDLAQLRGIGPSDLLLLQCNLRPDVTLFAAREAKRAGARVIFNPAPLKPWARSLEDLADAVILNMQEARSWTAKATAPEAISGLNVPCAIITLGADGCLARIRGEAAMQFPAPMAAAVDTTGAGDTFVGVFAAEWQATGEHERAIGLALLAASASVSRPGAVGSIPRRHEIDDLRRLLP
jgi:ribokinase